MSSDPLARPMWNALSGLQAHLATRVEDGAAVRLDPGYGSFAGARDAGDEAQAALASLIGGGDDQVWVVEEAAWPAPAGAQVAATVPLVQMVLRALPPLEDDDMGIVLLGESDAPEMASLAAEAEPGPWGPQTHRYGQFFGARQGGLLRAMAGERFRPAADFAEVSGVATWPAWRGGGLAARCMRRVIHGFAARGATAYLHCRAENEGAIRLYERLGFAFSREMTVTVLERT